MNRALKFVIPGLIIAISITLAFGSGWAKKQQSGIPWIGIYTQDIDKELAEAFRIDRDQGIVIVDIVDDSPADEAGLRKKDIVIEFNGHKIGPDERLSDYVREMEIGDETEIVVLRKGEEKRLPIEIGKKPNAAWRNNYHWQDAQHFFNDALALSFTNRGYIGISIQDLNEQLGDYFGVVDGDGVLVTEVFEDSPAEEAGLKAGDVIVAANNGPVTDTDDLRDILSDFEGGDTVTIEYMRRGDRQTVSVEVTDESFWGSGYAPGNLNFNIPVPSVPSVPRLQGLSSYYLDKDVLPELKDFEDEMQDLKKELDELRKELRELESKLE